MVTAPANSPFLSKSLYPAPIRGLSSTVKPRFVTPKSLLSTNVS